MTIASLDQFCELTRRVRLAREATSFAMKVQVQAEADLSRLGEMFAKERSLDVSKDHYFRHEEQIYKAVYSRIDNVGSIMWHLQPIDIVEDVE